MSKYGYERAGKVTPAVPDEVMSFVVRGFGYAIEHLAELRAGQVVLLRARPGLCGGLAAASPVVAICGQRVRSARPFVRVLTSPSQDSLILAAPASAHDSASDVTRRPAGSS